MNRFIIMDRQGMIVQYITCTRFFKDFATGALHFVDDEGMMVASIFSDGIVTIIPDKKEESNELLPQ